MDFNIVARTQLQSDPEQAGRVYSQLCSLAPEHPRALIISPGRPVLEEDDAAPVNHQRHLGNLVQAAVHTLPEGWSIEVAMTEDDGIVVRVWDPVHYAFSSRAETIEEKFADALAYVTQNRRAASLDSIMTGLGIKRVG